MNSTSIINDETGNSTLDTILIVLVGIIASVLIFSLTGFSFLEAPQYYGYQASDASPLNVLLSILLATVPIIVCLKAISGANANHAHRKQTERE
jgi:hypothetical protein